MTFDGDVRLEPELVAAIERELDSSVFALRPVSGGDINQCFRADTGSGRPVFLKVHAALPGFFEAEAEGLRWLDVPGGPRIPSVLALGTTGRSSWLALEYVPLARGSAEGEAAMGRALATLHRAGAPSFGAIASNYIGPLPQDNDADPALTWGEFYAQKRLLPLYERARRKGHFAAGDDRRMERLCGRLDDLFPAEAPSRLHGDLWGGNGAYDDRGRPVIFDPAAYGGHREMDLAMMELFGGFGARVFAAYDELHPRAPGAQERVPLAQLYPLLVHVILFGGGYEGGVRRVLQTF